MSKADLIAIIDVGIAALQLHRRFVSIRLLDKADELLSNLHKLPALRAMASQFLDMNMNEVSMFISVAQEAVDFDRKFLGQEDDLKIIEMLDKIKHRPLLLGALAILVIRGSMEDDHE